MTLLSYSNRSASAPGRRQPSFWWRWLGLASAMLIWMVPAAILVALTTAASGLVFMPLGLGWLVGPFVTLFIVYSLNRALASRRRRNGVMLLSYVQTATRLNLPLVSFLLAAGRSERGGRARQLQRLGQMIGSGSPVAGALEWMKDVPGEIVGVISAHEQAGQLRSGLARVMHDEREKELASTREQDRASYRFYALYLLLVLGGVGLLFAWFVVPKFAEIFKDFKMDLPPETRYLVWLIEVPFPYAPVLVAIGALALWVTFAVYMSRIFLPRWPLPRFGRAADWLASRTPVVREVVKSRGMAQVCDLFAESMRAGIPLDGAATRALLLPVNTGLRRRIFAFRKSLLHGRPAADAAREAGLPRLMTGMLRIPAGARGGASAASSEMFEFLARYYREKFSRLILLIRSASEPSIVILMGSMVLFFTYGLLHPLVTLLDSVMQSGQGGVM